MTTRATHVRVADGAIQEAYLTKEMIAVRGHPLGWYVPIVYEVMPQVTEFQFAKPTMRLMGNVQPDVNGFFTDCQVHVTYAVEDKSLQALLRAVFGSLAFDQKLMPFVQPAEAKPVVVSSEMLKAIKAQAKKELEKALDAFAKERDYDNIDRLCSHATSTEPEWQKEALIGVEKRDASWKAFYKLFDGYEADPITLFKTLQEFKAQLPSLTW